MYASGCASEAADFLACHGTGGPHHRSSRYSASPEIQLPGTPPNSCELETLIGGDFCRVLTDARRFSAKQNEVQQEPPGLFDGIVRLGTMGAVHHEE